MLWEPDPDVDVDDGCGMLLVLAGVIGIDEDERLFEGGGELGGREADMMTHGRQVQGRWRRTGSLYTSKYTIYFRHENRVSWLSAI